MICVNSLSERRQIREMQLSSTLHKKRVLKCFRIFCTYAPIVLTTQLNNISCSAVIIPQFRSKQINTEPTFWESARMCVYSLEPQTLHLAAFSRPCGFCLGSFVHVTLWLTRCWVGNSSTSHWPRPCTWAFLSPINIKVGQGLFLGETAWQIVFVFMIHASAY